MGKWSYGKRHTACEATPCMRGSSEWPLPRCPPGELRDAQNRILLIKQQKVTFHCEALRYHDSNALRPDPLQMSSERL